MKSAILLAAILFAVSASAHAQAFKCRTKDGRTFFSDSPNCDTEIDPARSARPARSDSGRSAGVESPIDLGKSLCADKAPRQYTWKDRESLRIEGVHGGQLIAVQYAGKPMAVRRFQVMANAKNGFGAYAGAMAITCYTSEDGRRMLNSDEVKR